MTHNENRTAVLVSLRRVLHRLDAWTLIAFNPRYPTPSRDR